MPVKNEEEAHEKTMSMRRNNDHKTGNLLVFAYFKEHFKLIAIDLSTQTKLKDPQQISFIGKLENQAHAHEATKVFNIEERRIRRNNFWIFAKFCKHLIKMEISI